jgi:hypothetical protein
VNEFVVVELVVRVIVRMRPRSDEVENHVNGPCNMMNGRLLKGNFKQPE